MKNKNILHIIPKLSDYGGTPNKLKLLVKYKSNNVNYIFLTFDNNEEASLVRNFISINGKIINVKISKVKILKNFFKIYFKIRKQNIDCICVHFFKSSFYGFLLSIILNKKLIIFENGIIDYESKIKELFFFIAGLKADKVICNSQDTLDSIKHRYSLKKIQLITNGIEKQNATKLINKNFKNENFNILFIGGLIKLRNIDILIKSISLLKINYTLTIIGDGPEKNNLISLSKKLNINSNVEFTGYINKKFIETNHYKFDLFVSCVEKEGFGYSLFEAICFKIPILIYKNSTYSKLLKRHKKANYFDKLNENKISNKINKIYVNYEYAKNKAEELEKYCIKNFSIQKFTYKIESIY